MTAIRVAHPVAPADRDAVLRLHERAANVDGHPSLNETMWRDLEHGGPDSAGALAVDGDQLVGYAHAARSDNVTPRHWEVGLVVDPERRGGGLPGQLLAAVNRYVADHGGGLAVLWVLAVGDDDDRSFAPAGYERQRDLLEMRVALPVDEAPQWPPGFQVRTFEPGRDEDEWLDVNNRAFADHPEQGGWVEETLAIRMREPWFDPKGFLLGFDAEGLAGFCWTKIHPPEPGEPNTRGEIFVIGKVRPVPGLGRALVVAGLQSLAERGADVGMLFVDAGNEVALGLYQSLGFHTHRHDRAYECRVDAL